MVALGNLRSKLIIEQLNCGLDLPMTILFRPNEQQTTIFTGPVDLTISVEVPHNNVQKPLKDMRHRNEVHKVDNGKTLRFNLDMELKTGILELSHHINTLESSSRYNFKNELGKIAVSAVRMIQKDCDPVTSVMGNEIYNFHNQMQVIKLSVYPEEFGKSITSYIGSSIQQQ